MTRRKAGPGATDSQDSAGHAPRKRAEEIVRVKKVCFPDASQPQQWNPEQARKILHELQVHQV